MINCLVCVKYVPDAAGSASVGIDRESTVGKINPADMFAIEEAIRIREAGDGSATGLCMGVASAEAALKTAVAMGLDDIFLLSDKIFAGSDTLATSYVLSKGIQNTGNCNLVLCGKQSTDGDTGQVGQAIATHLDWPCIINVVSIRFDNDNNMICKVLDDNGYIFLKTKLPAVVCVLKGINEPRIPTITGVLKAQRYGVKIFDSFALGVKPEKCGLLGSPTRVKHASAYEFNMRSSTDITSNYIERLNGIFALNKRREDIDAEAAVPVLHSAPSGGDIWVASEITGGKIADVSLELLSKAKELALMSNKSLSSMIFNPLDEAAVDEAQACGVDTIMYSNDSFERFDETYAKNLANMCKIHKPSVLLFGSTTWGKWIAPYVAVKLQTGLTADCIELRFDEDCDDLIQTRIAFGGNILADIFTPNARPQMATVRKGVFKKVFRKAANPPCMIDIGASVDMSNRIEAVDSREKKEGVNLSVANILVTGGRGVGKENFPLLYKLAKLIGGTVGATRYAVDAGWVDYERQIGQTGVIVRPRLLLAFGVSGASEHLIGMRDSDCIVSVNTNSDAPILSVSDYRIVADCGEVLNSLITNIERTVKLL